MRLTLSQCVDPMLRRAVPSLELELVFALYHCLHNGARQGARDPRLQPAHVVLLTPQPQVVAQTHLQTHRIKRVSIDSQSSSMEIFSLLAIMDKNGFPISQ